MRAASAAAGLAALLSMSQPALADSQCFGTVSNGRLEGGVKLPEQGMNFAAYSKLGAKVNRTYVHAKVAATILASYAALAASTPDIKWVYGETGFPDGGRFKPHKTHQNGLSVDFFVPVRTGKGVPTVLPSTIKNRFGYLVEFDAKGRFEDYHIDFGAYAEHLYQLDVAARQLGIGIALVIADPAHLPLLFAAPRGKSLRKLPFMKTRPWVRHDEHFHIDFAIPCRPLP